MGEFRRLVRNDALVRRMYHLGLTHKEMIVILAEERQRLIEKLADAERLRPVVYEMDGDSLNVRTEK